MDLQSLMAAGLSESQANAVLQQHNAAIANNFVPLQRFNEVNSNLQNTRTQLNSLNTQHSTLTGQYAQLQAAITAEDEKLKKAIVRASLAERVVDVEVAMDLLAMDQISVAEDGSVTGIEDAYDALVKDKPWIKPISNPNPKPSTNPQGFTIFGNPPKSSSGEPSGDQGNNPGDFDPVKFAQSLATAKTGTADAAQKAANYYFKNE